MVGFDSDHNIRFPVPELFCDGQTMDGGGGGRWHHIVLVLNRTLLKNSTLNVYIDGRAKFLPTHPSNHHHGHQQQSSSYKLHYISSIVGGQPGIANTSPLYINAFIGTPPAHRRLPSSLLWKQGPCHLVEELLQPSFVAYIFMLGPNYIGSFQAVNYLPGGSMAQSIAEDRLIFGLNSRATSIMTLSKMRRVYSRFDCKQIAKIIGISSHENATPIYVLHNSAGHLCGPSRPLGGVLIGNVGARCFVPKQITLTFSDIGGAYPLLGLIANAASMEALYAGVKALVCVLRANVELQLEMERINGYQTMAMLLRRKRPHLNSHILHLLFELISSLNVRLLYQLSRTMYISSGGGASGSLDGSGSAAGGGGGGGGSSSSSSSFSSSGGHPANYRAFKELLVDSIDLWIQADLLKTVLEHLHEIIYESSAASSPETVESSRKELEEDVEEEEEPSSDYTVTLRNSLLKVVLQLMSRNSSPNVNAAMAEELVRVLGFDWFLLFLGRGLNAETTTIGAVNLMLVLSNSTLFLRFKDGGGGGGHHYNGGWLKDANSFIANKGGLQLLGFNISTSSSSESSSHPENSGGQQKDQQSTSAGGHRQSRAINSIQKELLTLPGFQHLNWLLAAHCYKPKVYLILLQTMFGYYRPSSLTPATLEKIEQCTELTTDSLMRALMGGGGGGRNPKTFKSEEMVCKELAVAVFALLNAVFWSPPGGRHALKYREYPRVLMYFVRYLYSNNRDFRFYCQGNGDLLNALCRSVISNPLTGVETELTGHEGAQLVFDFILTIFVNVINTGHPSGGGSTSGGLSGSLSGLTNVATTALFSSQKPITTFEAILAGFAPCRQAQTRFLSLFMDTVISSQEYNSFHHPQHHQQQQLPPESATIILNFSHAFANIVLMMSTVVDRLWANAYVDDRKKVLECLVRILRVHAANESAKGAGQQSSSTSSASATFTKSLKSLTFQLSEVTLLYKSANRCLLYLISRSVDSMADRMFIFEVLQLLYQHRAVLITSKANSDAEFFICLTHCLLQLIDAEAISLASSANKSLGGGGNSRSGAVPSNSTCNSTALWTVMPRKDALYWTSIHASIIRDFVEHQVRQKRILDYHLKKYVLTEWLNYEYEFLTREKAIWGPTYGSRRLDKWMLDMTEGPNRMRKKMIRNEQFYTHYPYRPEFDAMDARMIKFKSPVSHDSKEYYRRVYSERYFHLDKLEGGGQQSFELEVTVDGVGGGGGGTPVRSACNSTSSPKAAFGGGDGRRTPLSSARVLRTKSSSDYDDNDGPLSAGDAFDGSASSDAFDLLSEYVDVNSSELEGGAGPATPGGKQASGANVKKEEGEQNDNEAILRLLEEGETISHMFRVARVQGLDSFEGLLLFGKEHFYLVDGFTLLKSREIRDIDSLPANLHDPIIPSTTPQPFSSSSSAASAASTRQVTKKVCSKFAYEDIKEVHKRRYLLQPIALELFSLDGRNSLVVFPRHLRNKVYSRFLSVAVHITDNAADSLMGQKRSANVETGGLLSNFIGETSVTQRWVRGEISNFQYLMNLNTLAGRSYNDLMQYPVFPWIVADYSSPELDLSNPASFRDLSKPMGAQTTERLEQFKKRFSEFDADTNMKGGPYHYGTFYSSAMIVASYLVRLEPFTQHFLRLQGGHFDLADRMFHSVGDAWLSAAKHNMADLKELIPEFFYLPEFLRNSNRFDFGAKQNGVKLDDVVLPPWAKDDPREFIRVHRAALECDYVSAHLHEWIDLIFGAKQNGPAAVEATNVFHHLFYEGNADIYNIDDPLKKNATIGFINNFGQIPKQLFKKPHPMKKVFSFGGAGGGGSGSGGHSFGPAGSKVFIHYLDHLRPSLQPIKELKGAVGQIIQQEKATLLAVEQNKVLIPPAFNRYVAWGFADHSLRIGPYESDRALYVWESELFPPNGEILCSTVPNSRVIVTAGTNSVISVWRFKGRQALVLSLVQKLYGHTEAVTCLASSASYGIIVSGSRDRTCILWDLNRLVFIRQLGGGPTPLHGCPVAAIAINDLTGDIATCCSTMLYLWTINGELIASVNTLHVPVSANCSQILCLAFSTYNEWDANNVILTGSSDGVVKLWTVAYVQEQ
ncbi:PREDICTED: WD repeat and FYVE domain-containing protein 3-like, partial [Rhagoletis zephyria]|uniref:WD repeat and FYVE domain-containing protein 3-like n=1 Tax=Rhagoletis zephyria TaxID=28612 RepID=UPI000811303C